MTPVTLACCKRSPALCPGLHLHGTGEEYGHSSRPLAPAPKLPARSKVHARKFAIASILALATFLGLGVSFRSISTYKSLSTFIPSQREPPLEVRRFNKSWARWDDVTSDSALLRNSSKGSWHNNHSVSDEARILQIPNRTIMLIHVGKSGGSTFRASLQKRYWRPGNLLQQQQFISPPCHMWACKEMETDRSTSFLFIVRNPVDRMISTYKYSHPDNCLRFVNRKGRNVTNDIFGCRVPEKVKPFYHECAPTLEDLANVPYMSEVALESNENCRLEIELFVKGNQKQGRSRSHHAFYNYRYYKSRTVDKYNPVSKWRSNKTNLTIYEAKEILVVRNEHMWQDAASLDRMLGGSGDFNTQLRLTHGSENYKNHTSMLSNQGYRRLCCMMHEEIQVYENIIHLAVNLNTTAKKQTILDVERKCGVGDYPSRLVWAQTCRAKLSESTFN